MHTCSTEWHVINSKDCNKYSVKLELEVLPKYNLNEKFLHSSQYLFYFDILTLLLHPHFKTNRHLIVKKKDRVIFLALRPIIAK